MGMKWAEKFCKDLSKAHPLNEKIQDTDIFLHGTSSKRYAAIEASGRLKRKIPKEQRNYPISPQGICFCRYDKSIEDDSESVVEDYWKTACDDGSLEGIVLQIEGKELKKLGCPIYADWNNCMFVCDSEGKPVDINADDDPYLEIIVTKCDISLQYLTVVKRIPFQEKSEKTKI